MKATVALLFLPFLAACSQDEAPVVRPDQPPRCTPGGWCWEQPRPLGPDLHGLWGTSPDNLWVLGWNGAIYHWDGERWSASHTAEGRVNALWGSAADSLWAVGDAGVILRWNGRAWARVASGTELDLHDVFGASADDVWAVGGNSTGEGVILRWEGRSWATAFDAAGPTPRAVWASGPRDAWALLEGGLLHWDGTRWSGSDPPARAFPRPGEAREPIFSSLWGTSRDDLWIAGDHGYVARWDGRIWMEVTTGVAADLSVVRGLGREVWIAGARGTVARWDGSRWQAITTGSQDELRDLWPTDRGYAWVVGEGGTLAHIRGQTWLPFSTELSDHDIPISACWGSGPDDVWMVGDGGFTARWNGRELVAVRSDTSANLWDVWGAGAEVWSVGSVEHADGVSTGVILRWTGAAWAAALEWPKRLRSVAGTGARDVWAVGDEGTALHWDGATWSPTDTRTQRDLGRVWTPGPGAAWAFATDATALHWDGSTWQPIESPPVSTAPRERLVNYSAWGSGPDDVWVQGAMGLSSPVKNETWHWDGSTWSQSQEVAGIFDERGLGGWTALSGRASNDLWAVNGSGRLLHWNGVAWSVDQTVRGLHLLDVWAAPSGELWAVGHRGFVLRRPSRPPD
jgi:hypothetical protein